MDDMERRDGRAKEMKQHCWKIAAAVTLIMSSVFSRGSLYVGLHPDRRPETRTSVQGIGTRVENASPVEIRCVFYLADHARDKSSWGVVVGSDR